MRFLLDTHTLLCWQTDDAQLSIAARETTADANNRIFVSAATAWEISTKQQLGKLNIPLASERFAELVAADGFIHLPADHRHALRAGGYASAHRDPFDRLLAAQSEIDNLTLLTRDRAFAAFGVPTLW